MKSLLILLVLSIGANGLLGGYLAGHLSHGHEHCKCQCDCDCDCCKPGRTPAPPQPSPEPEASRPSIEDLKRLRGWVPS